MIMNTIITINEEQKEIDNGSKKFHHGIFEVYHILMIFFEIVALIKKYNNIIYIQLV